MKSLYRIDMKGLSLLLTIKVPVPWTITMKYYFMPENIDAKL